MVLERTERFKRGFKKLDRQDRDRLVKALRLLATDPRRRSLRVKRLQGTAAIWEARASDELRITFELSEDRILLRGAGRHDPTLRSP